MESRLIGQDLRSNPQGLVLPDQAGRHILVRPVGKVAGVVLSVIAVVRVTAG